MSTSSVIVKGQKVVHADVTWKGLTQGKKNNVACIGQTLKTRL